MCLCCHTQELQEKRMSTSTHDTINRYIHVLQSRKDVWVAASIYERIAILEILIKDFAALAPRWIAASCQAKDIAEDSLFAGEEWVSGPFPVLKNLRQLRQALLDIKVYGYPRIPGPVTTRADGQVIAQVFPLTLYDRLLCTGIRAEIWMEPGVSVETLSQTQAVVYQDKNHEGRVALVLGAGNVSSIVPMDILYKLFVEDQVVLLKMNPVNAYLGPLIEEGFRVLVERGFLRVTYGGATEGAYLCRHPGIDDIHITGSDKTFDAIVFGSGPEGAARKARRQPFLSKRVTSELGNVSPLIVVPGPWRPDDLAYQAEQIVTSLVNNAGFNCTATQVIISHAAWDQRNLLLQQIRQLLARTPTRTAYYPGALERQRTLTSAHPQAEQIGPASARQLPWTLLAGIDPEQHDLCFSTEAFCGLFAETALAADNTSAYIDQAVAFVNERLWGSLNATMIVHPQSLKVPAIAAAVERAIANLRYGTVGVNYWAGTAFTLGTTTWGAFPGHPAYDIQSGTGVVHNTLMFARPQKSVVRAPFRSIPTPLWFVTHGKRAQQVFPRLCHFEASPSLWKALALMWSALSAR
jgi:hypothetical protein